MLKANKHLNRGTKTQKHKKEQKQRYMTQGNKEKKRQKNSDQGFWAEVCVRIHEPAYMGQLYAYAYFKPTCAYRIMRAQTFPQKP